MAPPIRLKISGKFISMPSGFRAWCRWPPRRKAAEENARGEEVEAPAWLPDYFYRTYVLDHPIRGVIRGQAERAVPVLRAGAVLLARLVLLVGSGFGLNA
jgi:hypothetical protein